MRAKGNWKTRRVTAVMSDSYHTLHLAQTKMPVRLKQMTVDEAIYEGPINALWERLREELEATGLPRDLDLVGVLVATDIVMWEGRINWLEQSEISEVEEGSDYLKEGAEQ